MEASSCASVVYDVTKLNHMTPLEVVDVALRLPQALQVIEETYALDVILASTQNIASATGGLLEITWLWIEMFLNRIAHSHIVLFWKLCNCLMRPLMSMSNSLLRFFIHHHQVTKINLSTVQTCQQSRYSDAFSLHPLGLLPHGQHREPHERVPRAGCGRWKMEGRSCLHHQVPDGCPKYSAH
jgi:hypothetical protein